VCFSIYEKNTACGRSLVAPVPGSTTNRNLQLSRLRRSCWQSSSISGPEHVEQHDAPCDGSCSPERCSGLVCPSKCGGGLHGNVPMEGLEKRQTCIRIVRVGCCNPAVNQCADTFIAVTATHKQVRACSILSLVISGLLHSIWSICKPGITDPPKASITP
jgi:hypothetical protein